MPSTETMRTVRVPIAGYIDVEIPADIAPEISSGLKGETMFEIASVDAANDVLADLQFPVGGSPTEWVINALAQIVQGNVLLAEQNVVDDLGID